MVAGYECYHDKKQRKAVGAFVASVNQTHSLFHSSAKIHENNEGISPNFREFIYGSLM
jgi:aubergine-like protein